MQCLHCSDYGCCLSENIYNSVLGLMVHTWQPSKVWLWSFPAMRYLFLRLYQVIRAMLLLFFSVWWISYVGLWQLNYWERNTNVDFSQSRPFLANMFKVKYWHYPCVDKCVKASIFASVHFKTVHPDSGLMVCLTHCLHLLLSLHSLSLGQLRFLLQARVYFHFQLQDQIFLSSIMTGETLKL